MPGRTLDDGAAIGLDTPIGEGLDQMQVWMDATFQLLVRHPGLRIAELVVFLGTWAHEQRRVMRLGIEQGLWHVRVHEGSREFYARVAPQLDTASSQAVARLISR